MKRSSHDIALELLAVRQEKNRLILQDKVLSKELRDSKDFKEQDVFEVKPFVSLIVKDREVAMKWVQENAPDVLEINTVKVRRIFERNLQIPLGFDTKLVDRLVAKGEEELE